jgi:predicted nucleotide-binding protein (sugar kinase/HSP70/actin superfamily)
MRTFINVRTDDRCKLHIIANCELGILNDDSGGSTDKHPLKNRPKTEHALNFIHLSNREMFRSLKPVSSTSSSAIMHKQHHIRRKKPPSQIIIGMPRVLSMYSHGLFFRAYFEHLGVNQVYFSSYTSPDLCRRTAGRGSIDPCFPSKIAISHVYDLMHRDGITHIFYPCIRMERGEIYEAPYHWTCAALAATPEAVKAAFTMERNEFHHLGIQYLNPVLDIAELDVLERQIYSCLSPHFNFSRGDNRRALVKALSIWDQYLQNLRKKAAAAIKRLERNGKLGIVLLGKPYHNDPGVNHGILDALNRHGYPVFTIESLPRDGEIVERIFEEEIQRTHQMDIRDEWSKCYCENTSLKIWAARFVSRSPNLIGLDISSFRCGHDAPLYSVLDGIFSRSSSPFFTFHEIDENKPESSIRLRIETIHYFLQRYREDMSQKDTNQWQRSLSAV